MARKSKAGFGKPVSGLAGGQKIPVVAQREIKGSARSGEVLMVSKPGRRRLVSGPAPSINERIEAARAVREGLAFDDAEALLASSEVDIDDLIEAGVVPRRTWSHARSEGRISPNVVQRIARFIRISTLARETFGVGKASIWLKRPTTALDGESPLSLLDTDEGARAVETLLGRIAHGIAA